MKNEFNDNDVDTILENVMTQEDKSLWAKKLLEHLPKKGDETLTVLKGHLLLETLLNDFIEHGSFKKESKLSKERIEFSHKINICEAFAIVNNDHLFNGLRKLNSIRNKYSHNLEPKGIEDKTADFIEYMEEHYCQTPSQAFMVNYDKVAISIYRLYLDLASTVTFQKAFVDELIK